MLFERQTTRYPDLYPWAQDYVKAMRDGFWTVDKFSFEADIQDFSTKLAPAEKQLLIRTLAAIAQIEVNVKTYWANLHRHLPHPGMMSLGITMAHIEDIHDKAYARLIEVLGQMEIFKSIIDVPVIQKRMKYLAKYTDRVYDNDQKQFIYSLILFTLFTENVSLFTQFYIVMFLNREDGVMKDAAQQVKYTRNEELLHAQAGMRIIQELKKEYPHLFDQELEDRIREECLVAYDAERELIKWILDGYGRDGLNFDALDNFIKDRLNSSLQGIGYKPQFEINTNLLMDTDWMERGAYAPVKFDFFHGENTEYLMEDMPRDDNFDARLALNF
ncbi:ribonucleoside-diphosphate reductase beta chain [Ochrobactrum sp. P20RRXII]|nr:ribonucleotide-diphosphate reductase subunit beta [Ochrobactrum sp. P20RRXII]NIH77329.1 ribonucleoside-diphosphate reductase beta chain [Ochrobactrum sp. P20RRXII]